MASIYQDKLSQKADYHTTLIERKDKWKQEEMVDKQEARADASKRDHLMWKHEEKKSRLEREQVIVEKSPSEAKTKKLHNTNIKLQMRRRQSK